MSKITTLLAILACLTTVLALNPTLTKNFFFVNTYNTLSYKLFHTTNGIIAYNVEPSSMAPPQYLLLDAVKGDATLILQDILSSCGHIGSGVFDRLQYHIETSTLAYFCTANNSLLILDEKTYTVKETIPTGISANFSEAKLTSDGSSLYVLLMGALYTDNQLPSQLVQIDLSTRKVVTSVVFDKGLESNEYVNGFVSQNNEAFALTNNFNSTSDVTTIKIYSVSLTGNTSVLVKLASFTNSGYLFWTNWLSHLYLVGDYIATNNLRDLIFLDKQGKIVSTFPMIGFKFPNTQEVSALPAMVSHEGSSDLYVLFDNKTLIKFTVDNGVIIQEAVTSAFDFQVAYGNHYTNDLLFTIDTNQLNFSITTLQNSDLVYSVPASFDDFMIANSTFGVLKFGNLQVFNRQTNALIGNVSIPTGFYLHKDTDTLYFSQVSNTSFDCIIKQLDLTTLSIVEIQEYPLYDFCASISEFKISDTSNPEFVALSPTDNAFTIVTETHGIVNFDLAEFTNNIEIMVPDYDTMSLYRLQTTYSSNSTNVSYYEYNGTDFNLKNSYDINTGAVWSFYSTGNQKVFAFTSGAFSIIDLEYGSTTHYSVPTDTHIVSSFQDDAGKKHLILSDTRTNMEWTGQVTQPSLFDSNGVSPLPGTTEFTVQAGAAGPCSYWIVDGFVSSVGLVKFYDACSQSIQEKTNVFSILQ